jgi:hypothetical protein
MLAFSAVTRICGLVEDGSVAVGGIGVKTKGEAGGNVPPLAVVVTGELADLADALDTPDLALGVVGFFFAASALPSGVSAAAAASSGFAGRT